MTYDDANKKWVPSGTSSGLSKVHIFQNLTNNTFRVVARKLQDHEVVINCCILKGLKYNQATNTFHQWRDNKQIYGLNFSSREDADTFARAMIHALEILSNNSLPRPPAQPPLQPQSQTIYPQTNGQYEMPEEVVGYRNQRAGIYHQVSPGGPQRIELSPGSHSRTMTREDVAIIQERRMSQQSQIVNNGNVSSPSGPGVPATVPPGHHRTSSAPPAPQPPPMTLLAPVAPPPAPPAPPVPCAPIPPAAPPAPAAPPMMMMGGGAPPPPPPPPQPNMSRSSSSDGQDISSLAAQLQSARLKRSNKQSAENSGSSTSSSGSNYGTLGRGGTGMASMMDEMARTLARRRAAAEKKDSTDNTPQESDYGTGDRKTWGTGGGNSKLGNGCEASPKPTRKQLASSEESLPKVNGDTGLSDMEALKQDILREIRREINKMKTDIIEG
ncbi:hypothetical protein AAG570_001718 [Ranatra chinensis]|uniref:WH1 domain-containing protein n=1 Tax=Ranatra chinensis TaxID=642074 RepID=A0ABD0Y9B2_9HEMI